MQQIIINNKILSFVTDGERFLLLRNNFEDLSHGGDFWSVVTGSVEGGEDYSEKNFLAFVDNEDIVLNEEHIDFEWLNLNEFIKKINGEV